MNTDERTSLNVMLVALILALLYWIVDAFFHYYYFSNELQFMMFEVPDTFLDALFFDLSPRILFTRLSFLAACLLGGLMTIFFIQKEKQIKNELTRKEATLSGYIKNSPNGIFLLDENRKYIQVNEMACYVTGYTESELLNMELKDIVSVNGLETIEQHRHKLKEKGHSTTIVPYLTRNSASGYWKLDAVKLPNGNYLEFATDISEQKNTELALARSEEKYRLLANNVVDVIWTLNLDLEFTYVNPAIYNLTGYTPDEWIGTKLTDHCDEANFSIAYSTVMQTIQSLPDITSETFEMELIKKNAKIVPVEIIGKVILDNEGNPTSLQGTTRDITERKRARQTLLEGKMLAEQANRTKTEFMANISHELRTPLNSIIGFSDVMIKEPERVAPEKHFRYLQNINKSGKHLLELINEILDITKIESGKMTLDLQTISVSQIFDDIQNVLYPIYTEKHISFNRRIDKGELLICADRTKLKQILYNLANNAIKFTRPGGYVFLNATKKDREIIFVVEDSGIGIPDNKQEIIFEPFKQLDSALSRKYGGTGLGLALVRSMVEMHGGTIKVESEEGNGSRFIFTIPH